MNRRILKYDLGNEAKDVTIEFDTQFRELCVQAQGGRVVLWCEHTALGITFAKYARTYRLVTTGQAFDLTGIARYIGTVQLRDGLVRNPPYALHVFEI